MTEKIHDCPNCRCTPPPTCARCKASIGDHWVDGEQYNSGRIEFGISSAMERTLTRHPRGDIHEHPLVPAVSAQACVVAWGDAHAGYNQRLCHSCQESFVHLIGDFFKLPEFNSERLING